MARPSLTQRHLEDSSRSINQKWEKSSFSLLSFALSRFSWTNVFIRAELSAGKKLTLSFALTFKVLLTSLPERFRQTRCTSVALGHEFRSSRKTHHGSHDASMLGFLFCYFTYCKYKKSLSTIDFCSSQSLYTVGALFSCNFLPPVEWLYCCEGMKLFCFTLGFILLSNRWAKIMLLSPAAKLCLDLMGD